MESVASQLRSLMALAGLTPKDLANYPIRRFMASTTAAAGPIAVPVRIKNGECVAITFLDTDNVDTSTTNTVAVSSNPNTIGYPAANLGAVAEIQTLYVFGAGTGTFTFNVTALPGVNATCRVSGFVLPQKALGVLGRIKVEVQS